MGDTERARLHYLIIRGFSGSLFEAPEPVEDLPLGPEYLLQMRQLNRERGDLLDRAVAELAKFDLSSLERDFEANGQPKTNEGKEWVEKYRQEVRSKFGQMLVWYDAPLFRTKDLADYEHWGRSEFLDLDEVVWLSVGLEPNQEFIELIKPSFSANGRYTKAGSIVEHMRRHKETIRRKFDPHNLGDRPDLVVLSQWIRSVGLVVHPKFSEMLENRVQSNVVKATSADENVTVFDSREKNSMSKLIVAMAIDFYGYDARALRSPVPLEIQGIADRLGLSISLDTIRKYLKAGAELLPDDINPE